MKAIVAILSAALVALGACAIHLWRQLDASHQQIADLKAQVDPAAASAHEVATNAPPSSLPLAEPTAAVPAAAPAPDADSKSLAVVAEADRLQAMLRARPSPEANARIKAGMIANMSNQYPDLGKVLGLSRDEVDKLLDLLYEQADRDSNVVPINDVPSVARLAQKSKEELVSLLGSKYAKWEEYKAEMPTRQHVRDLMAALNAAGAPLSEAQKNSLIQALVAEERRNSQTSSERPLPAKLYRFTPEASRNLRDAASGYLTPQQMTTYSQVLERASTQETVLRNRMLPLVEKGQAARQGQP